MSHRAVVIRQAGGPEVLSIETRDTRAPGAFELAVDVQAAGLNRADLLQRRGLYPAPKWAPADIPGLEYAGVVAARGEGVTRFEVGQRVMGIVAGGAMSEQLVVHEREAMPVPEGLSLVEAAAIPEAFLTAWDALFHIAALKMGQGALVHAVASGVGTAATQLIRAAGARSIGTTRSESKLERCAEYGLDQGLVVDAKAPRFAAQVREAFGGQGADVILDFVGAAYLEENLAALRTGGIVVVLGLMGGATGTLPLGELLKKRARLVGSTLRARPLEEKAALAQDFTERGVPLLARGALRPVVEDVMDMERIAEAHTRLENNATVGKLVLRWR